MFILISEMKEHRTNTGLKTHSTPPQQVPESGCEAMLSDCKNNLLRQIVFDSLTTQYP